MTFWFVLGLNKKGCLVNTVLEFLHILTLTLGAITTVSVNVCLMFTSITE